VASVFRLRWVVVVLGAVIIASVAGTICAVVPSMAFHCSDASHEYGLSTVIAPALFGAIVTFAARALRPSRKRLLLAAATIVGASILLLGIWAAREFQLRRDLDGHFSTGAPWAVHGFLACAIVLLVAGSVVLDHAVSLAPDRGPELAAARARIVYQTPANDD
jgi:hypothetical protein